MLSVFVALCVGFCRAVAWLPRVGRLFSLVCGVTGSCVLCWFMFDDLCLL